MVIELLIKKSVSGFVPHNTATPDFMKESTESWKWYKDLKFWNIREFCDEKTQNSQALCVCTSFMIYWMAY